MIVLLLLAEPNTPGSAGSRFLVAFMQNIPRSEGTPDPDAYMMVTTNETGTVEFDVTFDGTTTTYQVDSSAPLRINFVADDVYVTSIQQRDKAIMVESKNDKKISVQVINDELRSSDGFVALPCDSMTVPSDFRTYQYVILSANQDTTGQAGSAPRSSQFLVITCDGATTVTVQPTTTLTGSGFFQHAQFGPGTSQASSNWESTAAGQTLLMSITNADLTGTVVTGSKPLVVISGHQCGQVPEDVTACDHMSTQIPPHTTWGYTFLLNPLSGRQSGDLYRFATLLDNTDITITCVDEGGTTATTDYTGTLNAAVSANHGQFQTHTAGCMTDPYVPKYCSLESTNPIAVAQYSYGHTRDATCNMALSDPFMTLIPPMIQYLHVYHLVPVNLTAGSVLNHYYSVSVATRYFQPGRIMLDDAPLESDATLWQAIYCSGGQICGYGITKNFDNQYHRLYHADTNAAIFVHTYGFLNQNSYALAGGMELEALAGEYHSFLQQ